MFTKTANALAITAGIISLPALVWTVTGDLLVTLGSAATVGLVLGIPAVRYLIRPPFQYRHGVRYSGDKFIVPKKFERISISDGYTATVSTEKHFIFTEEPTEQDLVDTIETLPNDTVTENIYRSTSSTIRRVVRKSPSVVAVYWKPKKDIELFTPHIHNSEYDSPPGSEYGPGYFWQGYHCDVKTGFCNWKFCCPDEVEEAIAFTLPSWRSEVKLPLIWRYYAKRLRRDCVQPVISKNRREVVWNIATPRVGTTYVCIVVYQGGRSVFEKQATTS
jgi:hypothetical protein